ncbi:MAG: HNH endonuclease signature motif containing protein [Polyangiaceae bacterium]
MVQRALLGVGEISMIAGAPGVLARVFVGVGGFEVVRTRPVRALSLQRGQRSAWYKREMESLRAIGDRELLVRTVALVGRERAATVDVIEHLVEIDQRRLYLVQACSSLFSYCRERLGFSEDEAFRRARVARLAARHPEVISELRGGAIHLTGLSVLAPYAAKPNFSVLVSESRGKSRAQIERLLAVHCPREAGPAQIREQRSRVEPLSERKFRVGFSASAELIGKLERAQELLSHAVKSGDMAQLFERALDCLLEKETRRRLGAERALAPSRRPLRQGSRYLPVRVLRAVWERDQSQCTFEGAEGRRCSERRLLTVEHRVPFALGGEATVENLCLLCAAHNSHRARQVYGAEFIERKRAERAREPRSERALQVKPTQGSEALERARAALMRMGFGARDVRRALDRVVQPAAGPSHQGAEQLLRAALLVLTPSCSTHPEPPST